MTDTLEHANANARTRRIMLRVRVPKAANGFRTDIQALRAVAVLAVVANHLWPHGLTGGYVGVDVFFVISGFLITGHLGRELTDTGRVRLGRFYARRVRRLLPAAFLVLGFAVVASYFLLPYPRWAATAQHVIASALYGENWLLAAESVNYSAADTAASLTQHYWSLSVEEQFYLVWPVFLLLCFRYRRVGVVTVGAASLAFCVYFTATSPSEAYFVTPGRMWEFALGAVVALAGARLAIPTRVAGLVATVGLLMIVGSAVVYDQTTVFPGYLALVPTTGTALVILAGNQGWHTGFLALRPLQWLGDISYSLYLWHWPLLLLAPFALGRTLTLPDTLALLAAALILSYLTKIIVEDRGRTWKPLARSTPLTFAAMVLGLVAIVGASLTLGWTYDRHVAQAAREAPSPVERCHGADAMSGGCADPFRPARVTAMGPANEYYQLPSECRLLDDNMAGDTKTTNVCDFSGGAPDPEVVYLVGDSHAVQWQGPLVDLARAHHWVFKSATLGGCPFAKVDFTGYRTEATEEAREVCADWTQRMTDAIAAERPARVFMSFFARKENVDDGSGRPAAEQYRDGIEPYVGAWTHAGADVTVLADPPLNGDVRSADCVTLHESDPAQCAVDRSVAQPPDPLVEAARALDNPAVSVVDLTDRFCDKQKCYAVVGGVAVYFDENHMNLEFARSLRPMLAAALGYS
ncbi:acyltransferase family protein [Actinophytocola oryzae]|uniref:Peptidoglycan/LPS O-acetylase OafA/YrhL n=1 Tax=Actinophytocola oryzae TaxID=502181 RepID=A0A4R7VXZ2_9PSEU|nr:acyltransferase family protein [Actinophytocola oryzae]TDV54862.1 peptidoglycan/LPS O-acetylase OafA/YrhL [Actinophytocola oryzae]